jgi:hypothetical protein
MLGWNADWRRQVDKRRLDGRDPMSRAHIVLPLVAAALLLLAAAAFGGGDAAVDERVAAVLVLLAVLMAIIGAVLAAPRRSTEPDAPAMAERSDAELVSAARGHGDDAWAELRGRHRRAIAALLEYLLGDREHAEEVSDEVFATARRRLRDKPAETSFKQWIHSLALAAVTEPAVAPSAPGRTTCRRTPLRHSSRSRDA